jgi:hypothetical protein
LLRREDQASNPFDSLLAQQLTGCRAGLTIYVAASRHAPFLQLTQRDIFDPQLGSGRIAITAKDEQI